MRKTGYLNGAIFCINNEQNIQVQSTANIIKFQLDPICKVLVSAKKKSNIQNVHLLEINVCTECKSHWWKIVCNCNCWCYFFLFVFISSDWDKFDATFRKILNFQQCEKGLYILSPMTEIEIDSDAVEICRFIQNHQVMCCALCSLD